MERIEPSSKFHSFTGPPSEECRKHFYYGSKEGERCNHCGSKVIRNSISGELEWHTNGDSVRVYDLQGKLIEVKAQ